MRRILILAALYLLASLHAHADLRGSWNASQRDDGRVQMNLRREHHYNSHGFDRADFSGLTAAMMSGKGVAAFELVRDAGTITFDGVFSDGEGAGHFAFKPNARYASELRSLGIAAGEIDEERLFSLASLDVGASFIKEMQSLGVRGSLDDYESFRIHGVTPAFVREMRSLGYRAGGDGLVSFRIHGVTPEYVRELRALGYDHIAADDLVSMRIHGVTIDFIRKLKDVGYSAIPVEKLISMRIHGIDAEMVRKMSK
jgi:hypothetical protein